MRKTKPKTTKPAKPKAKTAKTSGGGKAKLKQPAKKKPSRRRRARKPAPVRARTVAIGEVVRLLARPENLIGRCDPTAARPAPGHREIRGIVCAIREVASGKLAMKTRGSLGKYVLEILQDLTFDKQYSSAQNTGAARGAFEPAVSPAWGRVREMVKEAVGRASQARPAAVLLGEDSFRRSLDGWRLVRVRAESMVTEEVGG
jgi:hypothetical protein